jgi:copper(I)-binding protein
MRPALGTALILALAACGGPASQPKISVEDARVQLPAVPGRPGSAYFRLESNVGDARLVGLSSPLVKRIELHETVEEDGVSRMRQLESGAFQRGRLDFEVGGKHAMLFGIDQDVKAGDEIPLVFDVEPIGTVSTQARVEAFSAEGHAGH